MGTALKLNLKMHTGIGQNKSFIMGLQTDMHRRKNQPLLVCGLSSLRNTAQNELNVRSV